MAWGLTTLLWIVVCGTLGRYIAESKGRNPIEGILLGALLGPIGLIIEAIL